MLDEKMARVRFRQVFKVMLLLVLGGLFALGFSTEAYADISKAPGYEVPDKNTTIAEKYNFVPRVTENTKAEAFGSNRWRTLDARSPKQTNPQPNPKYLGIDLRSSSLNNLKGKIGVRYTNVGYIDGQAIDLKITLMDWVPYGRSNPRFTATGGESDSIGNISFTTTAISMDSQGYENVHMRWEYVKAGTNTRVNVSGYLTMSDIDAYQGIWFSSDTANHIDKIMVENRNSLLKYSKGNCGHGSSVSGSMCIYDDTGVDVPDDSRDPRYRFTILYSDRSYLDFAWHNNTGKRMFNGTPITRDRRMYTDVAGGAQGDYFFYEMDKPARTAIPDPKKSVSSSKFKAGTTYTYTIEHNVPMEDVRYFYNSYKIVDTVDSTMTGLSAKIYNQAGKNVSDRFTINVKGQTVTATAKSSWLTREEFYGETYHMQIQGKLHESKTLDAIGSDSSYVVKNMATVHVDGKEYSSNEVESKAYKRKITVRHVDKKTDELLDSSVDYKLEGSTYQYNHRNDLTTKDGLSYRVVGDTSFKGTVEDKDITLTFYYEQPHTITVSHIDKDSGDILVSDVTRKHKGESYEFEARDDLKTKDGLSYRVVGDTSFKGTVEDKDIALTFYYERPRTLTVRHIDEDSGDILASNVTHKHKGESYEFEARDDLLYQDKYPYYVVGDKRKSGTVKADTTIDFYYKRPVADLGLERFSIKTNVYDESLPAKIDYKMIPLLDDQWQEQKIRVVIIESQSGRKVYEQEDKLDDVLNPSDEFISLDNSTKELKEEAMANKDDKGAVREYTVTIEPVDKRTLYISSDANSIMTEGTTSYYDTWHINSQTTRKTHKKKGVYMTERVLGEDMQTYYETITVSMPETAKLKTGYGFTHDASITYHNDLNEYGTPTTSISEEPYFHMNADVVSGPYEPVDDEGELVAVPNAGQIRETNEGLVSTYMFDRIALKAGSKTDDDFVLLADDQEVPDGYVDGGRRLFIDIWADESYVHGNRSDISYVSDAGYIGGNWHKIAMERHVDITAYMFSHTDSETPEKDELLLHPLPQEANEFD